MSDDSNRNEPDRLDGGGGPPERDHALIGVLFVVALVLGIIFLMNRLKTEAGIADCILSRGPNCVKPSDLR
jgi:hypothetical protein